MSIGRPTDGLKGINPENPIELKNSSFGVSSNDMMQTYGDDDPWYDKIIKGIIEAIIPDPFDRGGIGGCSCGGGTGELEIEDIVL